MSRCRFQCHLSFQKISFRADPNAILQFQLTNKYIFTLKRVQRPFCVAARACYNFLKTSKPHRTQPHANSAPLHPGSHPTPNPPSPNQQRPGAKYRRRTHQPCACQRKNNWSFSEGRRPENLEPATQNGCCAISDTGTENQSYTFKALRHARITCACKRRWRWIFSVGHKILRLPRKMDVARLIAGSRVKCVVFY